MILTAFGESVLKSSIFFSNLSMCSKISSFAESVRIRIIQTTKAIAYSAPSAFSSQGQSVLSD